MAKDDYDVLVFKILVYLYACLKRKILFNQVTFDRGICRDRIDDGYFIDILRMVQEEGLITGVATVHAWDSVYMLLSDLREMRITPAGIHYLKENGTMRKGQKALTGAADIIGSLVGIVGL